MKKSILGMTIGALLLAVALVTPAQAKGNDAAERTNQNMMVSVNPAGRATIQGKVTAISSSSVSIASWGGTWTVNFSGNVKAKYGQKLPLSSIKVGDVVTASGKISNNGGLTIDAVSIRDVNLNVKPSSLKGVISNLNAEAHSFTLTLSNGTTVNATLPLELWSKLMGSSTTISNGATVNLNGLLNQAAHEFFGSKVKIGK
jgi:hypothetical protein